MYEHDSQPHQHEFGDDLPNLDVEIDEKSKQRNELDDEDDDYEIDYKEEFEQNQQFIQEEELFEGQKQNLPKFEDSPKILNGEVNRYNN